ATTIQTTLNSLFNGLGFAGAPVAVTRTASGAGSGTYVISFAGTMANLNVLQLSASIAVAPESTSTSTQVQGALPNLTTINPNTQLDVRTPNGSTVSNPIVVYGAGPDSFSGAIVRNNTAGTATLAGDILLRSNTTFG